MRRAALGAVLISLVVAPATAAPASEIAPTSIAGARLGLHANAYKRLFGSPVRKDVLRYPQNYWRLVFTKRRVAVFFSSPGGKAVEIVTWNRNDRTAVGIGTCSTITRLKAAYGSKLKRDEPNTVGSPPRVYAYTVGRLIFAATGRDPKPGPSKHVTAIALYTGRLAVAGFIALQFDTSALRCA